MREVRGLKKAGNFSTTEFGRAAPWFEERKKINARGRNRSPRPDQKDHFKVTIIKMKLTLVNGAIIDIVDRGKAV
jgi:hypothetical protein